MDEYFHAAVPRRLRVRSSVVVGQSRMPLRVFLMLVGFVFVAGVLTTFGMPFTTVVTVLGPVLLALLVVVEGTIGGRTCRELAQIMLRHQLRPKRMRLVRPMETVLLGTQRSVTRPVRWLGEDRDRL